MINSNGSQAFSSNFLYINVKMSSIFVSTMCDRAPVSLPFLMQFSNLLMCY